MRTAEPAVRSSDWLGDARWGFRFVGARKAARENEDAKENGWCRHEAAPRQPDSVPPLMTWKGSSMQ